MGRLFTKEKLKNCCLSLLLAALVAAAGGCGGGSDGTAREKLYVAGELHGGLADALYTLACCAPYGGQTDAPLLISYEDGEGIDDQTADDARRVFEAGYAVGIEHATADEVNDFLDAMGLEPNFVMPESGESEDGTQLPAYDYVEFFGIKSIDGDVLSYTTLAAEEPEPLDIEPDTIYISVPKDELEELEKIGYEIPTSADIDDVTSGDICVEVSVDEYLEIAGNPEPTAEDREEMTALEHELDEYGWRLKENGDGTFTVIDKDWKPVTKEELKNKGVDFPTDTIDNDILFEDLITVEDEAELDRVMAESIIEWLFSTDIQAAETAAEKQAVAKALNASNAAGDDLKKISRMYRKTFDASTVHGHIFKIFVDVYACHTYNAAGGDEERDTDWYFVKQSAQLNPSGVYGISNSPTDSYPALVWGYTVSYSFDNWLVDEKGTEITNNAEILVPKPDSSIGSTSESEGASFSFGGNFGFSGLAASGGLSAGGGFSYEKSSTVSDCQVENRSQGLGGAKRAAWTYSFSRPQTTGHPFMSYNKFKEPPIASRSLFSPVNQWTWQIAPGARDAVTGFKFSFKWISGQSSSERYAFWIRTDAASHWDYMTDTTTFYVPFDAIKPPLIAANSVDVNAAEQTVTVDVGTCYKWEAKVTEGGTWCAIDSVKVDTNGGDNYMHLDVDRNDTGKSRTAKIKLSTTDNTNASCEITVYQSRY